MKFNYPAFLIAFNRADLTIKNIENLIKNGVEKLYLHIDGPTNGVDENDLSHKITLIIKKQPKNLGCDPGSIEAITWFF